MSACRPRQDVLARYSVGEARQPMKNTSIRNHAIIVTPMITFTIRELSVPTAEPNPDTAARVVPCFANSISNA